MHIGILGSGQLARMLALSAIPAGFRFTFFIEEGDQTVCVNGLGNIVLINEIDQLEDLPDVVTVEKEHIPVDRLELIASKSTLHPNLNAIYQIKNRVRQKELLLKHGLATAKFITSARSDELSAWGEQNQYQLIIKTAEEGYDGKGQWQISSADDLAQFQAENFEGEWIAEEKISFSKEFSIIGVRSANGDIAFYNPSENIHNKGILISSRVTSQSCTQAQKQTAQSYLTTLLEDLDYVGVLAMECFCAGDEVLINELAPRVHNSGHWTQLGAQCSQFENHVRAIGGMALGSTQAKGPAGMVNVLGQQPDPKEILSADSSYHWYGKEVKPLRKVGHINFCNASEEQLFQDMDSVINKLYPQ